MGVGVGVGGASPAKVFSLTLSLSLSFTLGFHPSRIQPPILFSLSILNACLFLSLSLSILNVCLSFPPSLSPSSTSVFFSPSLSLHTQCLSSFLSPTPLGFILPVSDWVGFGTLHNQFSPSTPTPCLSSHLRHSTWIHPLNHSLSLGCFVTVSRTGCPKGICA